MQRRRSGCEPDFVVRRGPESVVLNDRFESFEDDAVMRDPFHAIPYFVKMGHLLDRYLATVGEH